MNQLTYLYQALANARQTVTEIERAIEAIKATPPPPHTNLTREGFYNWIEETDNNLERKTDDG